MLTVNKVEEIARRIRDAREKKGWSQTQLAERSSVPQTVISRMERGAIAKPNHHALVSLADALGVPLDSLTMDSIRDGTSPQEPAGEPSPLERALFRVMRPDSEDLNVFDATRAVVRETRRIVRALADHDSDFVARALLDAAVELRKESEELSGVNILARYISNHATPPTTAKPAGKQR